MANENNGVFTDLLVAIGAPIQNVTDATINTVGNGINAASSAAQSSLNLLGTLATSSANSAGSAAQSSLNLLGTLATSSVNTAVAFMESLATAVTAVITTAITPKK
ncbi:MAG: hypothetical protein WCI01_11245 [Chlorobiaceae bacterium]